MSARFTLVIGLKGHTDGCSEPSRWQRVLERLGAAKVVAGRAGAMSVNKHTASALAVEE